MDKDKNTSCKQCVFYWLRTVCSQIKKNFWKHFYASIHIIVFFSLSGYVLLNWETCISMQFFSRFDGNNILFLVWIILIFLLIYEVEGKGFKVAKRKQEETQQSLNEADLKYKLDAMAERIKKRNMNLKGALENGEGDNQDGASS